MRNRVPGDLTELEAIETREWLDSLDYVLRTSGPARAGQLLLRRALSGRPQAIKELGIDPEKKNPATA